MTRKTDLIAMAEKLEVAMDPTYELFAEAVELITAHKITARRLKVRAAAHCGYWTSAAEMLVPEGWLIIRLSELGQAGACEVFLGCTGNDTSSLSDHGARTPALALAAAACRAHSGMCDDN